MKTAKICNRLKIVKTILGLDQNELAEKLGVTQKAISNYLTNRVPKWDTLVKIIDLAHKAGETNITLDWIIRGGELRASDEPPGLFVSDVPNEYQAVASDVAEKIQTIMDTVRLSPKERDIIYEFLNRSKRKTLFEKLYDLSEEQMDLLLNVIDNFKKG